MSARLVGQVLEHYPNGGSEFTLAIVLADEAQHSGGITASPIKELARLSRQSENNVRRILQKMEATTWLLCIERSKGGHARPSVYQINPAWVSLPLAFTFGKEPSQFGRDEPSKPSNLGRDEPYKNPPNLGGFSRETTVQSDPAPFLFKHSPPLPPQTSGSAVPSATAAGESEELRLAHWMFDLVLKLRPNHKPPSWSRWLRQIRVMVLEGRTLREIAELFAWANGDDFWQATIVSPEKLLQHWDTLAMRKAKDVQRGDAKPAPIDPLCETCRTREWSIQQGKAGKRLCRQCATEAEALA